MDLEFETQVILEPLNIEPGTPIDLERAWELHGLLQACLFSDSPGNKDCHGSARKDALATTLLLLRYLYHVEPGDGFIPVVEMLRESILISGILQ